MPNGWSTRFYWGLPITSWKLKARANCIFMQEGEEPPSGTVVSEREISCPDAVNEFVFEIGGKEHLLQVPAEFDLNELLARKFAGISDLNQLERVVPDPGYTGSRLKLSDDSFEEGDAVLAFDILHDALFVDRFTYNRRA